MVRSTASGCLSFDRRIREYGGYILKIPQELYEDTVTPYTLMRMTDSNDTKPKTKQEIAVHFGVTTRTIDGWMKSGILPYWKIGHLVRFDLGAVTARLNQKSLKNGGLRDAAR
jgi:hypothetical protein